MSSRFSSRRSPLPAPWSPTGSRPPAAGVGGLFRRHRRRVSGRICPFWHSFLARPHAHANRRVAATPHDHRRMGHGSLRWHCTCSVEPPKHHRPPVELSPKLARTGGGRSGGRILKMKTHYYVMCARSRSSFTRRRHQGALRTLRPGCGATAELLVRVRVHAGALQ